VKSDANKLLIDNRPFRMVGEKQFRSERGTTECSFFETDHCTLTREGFTTELMRVKEATFDEKYLGKYYNSTLKTTIKVLLVNGKLLMKFNNRYTAKPVFIFSDGFVSDYFDSLIHFKDDSLFISFERARMIRFIRVK
jgi:hypothetical protein